jgi:hypothetical protein
MNKKLALVSAILLAAGLLLAFVGCTGKTPDP